MDAVGGKACAMNDPDNSKQEHLPSEGNSKQEKLPLQFRYTKQVIECAADYQRDNANEIHVRIPKDMEGFTALTTFDITLNELPASEEPIDLLECWICWPPTQPGLEAANKLPKLPMIIRDVSSEEVEVEFIPEAIPNTNDKITTLQATSVSSSTIKISFKVPNVFFSLLEERAPFDHKRLTLNIRVLNGADSTVLHLTYPKAIAMRARADNSEYHSLVLSSEEDNYYRKATYFPQKDINIGYTFGTSVDLLPEN